MYRVWNAEFFTNVVVTGDDVEQLIPENSNVEITLHVDSSEMMTMEVYFPSIDFTIKKELSLGRRESPEDAISWVNKESRILNPIHQESW